MPYIILLFLLFGVAQLYGQDVQSPENKKFDIIFKKQNTYWNWRGNLSFNKDSEANFGIHVRDNFNTTLNIIDSKGNKAWKDQNDFDGFFYKKISAFQAGIYSKSWISYDEQTGNAVYISNHALGIKSNYSPAPNLIITPYAGYQRDEHESRIDWGWDLGLKGDFYNFQLDNYHGDLSLNLDYDLYKNRQNSINGIQIKIGTRFSPAAIDSLTASYGYENKQSLVSFNTLRNTIVEKKNIHNVLGYNLSRNSNLVLQTSLSSNTTDDNKSTFPHEDVLEFKNRFNYFYYLPKLVINFGFDTYQTTWDYTSIGSDSKELQTNIRTNVQYSLSSSDILNFNFYLGKYQYDTPDTSNHEERDQLSIVGGLQYFKEFSRALSLEIEATTDLVHQVYIFKEKSANNNWNRIFRLNSLIFYKFGEIRNTLRNEILANYTAYDFEEQLSESRSFILRQYILEDSLIFPIFPKLFTGFNGRLELEDKGIFIKNEFAQKILQSTTITFLDLFLRFKNIYLLNFDAGVAYYHRQDWRHMPEKHLIRDQNEITPYVRVKYHVYNKLRFIASAAYTFRDEMSKKQITYTTGSLSLIQYF